VRRALSIADGLALLEEHPKRIAAATRGIDATRLRAERIAGTWTATDVLAHLRSCSDVFVDVVPRILAADRPRLEVVGPRDRIDANGYRDLDFAVSFRAFVRQRPRILAILRGLPPRGASSEAVIVDRGRRRVRSVADYADWLARHEARHVEQFGRLAT